MPVHADSDSEECYPPPLRLTASMCVRVSFARIMYYMCVRITLASPRARVVCAVLGAEQSALVAPTKNVPRVL